MIKLTKVQWIVAVAASIIILASLALALWQGTQHQTVASVEVAADDAEVVNEPIQPIPLHIDLNQDKVALGRKLFREPMLSKDNTVSCASCHVLLNGGVDRLTHAVGINGQVGPINTPTVFNSGFNFRQFWDGRATTLEDQVAGPIHNPIEMGSNWDEVVKKLNASSSYVSAFGALYPDGITSTNISDAIATYERSLYTPNSRFDQYLRGNTQALTAQELTGYNLFKTYGCVSCHQGVNVGGNMYQRLGIVADYFADRGNITKVDYGRYNVTGNEQDRFVFKVPSLRMVALTGPYFHDGSIPTLEDAVKAMAHYQLGRSLSDDEVKAIVAFLKSLPGDNPELASGIGNP